MSRYEYGVLSLMARHPGQLFTKEQIFEAVWHQDSESCLTAVTNTIGRMQALGVDIQTIQSIVGHADTEMTEHYLHVQESIRQSAIQLFSEAFSA